MDIATFTVLYIAPDINSQQRNDDETRAEIKQRDKPSNHESFDDSIINEDALVLLGILKAGEYAIIKEQAKRISDLIKAELAKKDLTLYDIKLEFGRDSEGHLMLIDEISGGNMRVYDGDTYVEPLDLEGRLFE